jgi:hypothetical protein
MENKEVKLENCGCPFCDDKGATERQAFCAPCAVTSFTCPARPALPAVPNWRRRRSRNPEFSMPWSSARPRGRPLFILVGYPVRVILNLFDIF